MDYKNKYLKYKNKYLILKNQIGGTFTTQINLITDKINDKNKLIKFNESEIVYNSTDVRKREEINVIQMNENAISLNINFYDINFVALYDNIGALYMCSEVVQNYWNVLASEVGLNIAIFNGDGHIYKQIIYDKYIVGVNILAGCSTKNIATELNTEANNSEGKYFIGFDGYKHNYGTSFYLCGNNALYMTSEEFKSNYDALKDEIPIIKIIKIFYNKFKYCIEEKCRNCNKITLEYIKNKLITLKPKIEQKQQFKKNDCYFNSKHHINCNDNNVCKHDLYFEQYIKNIYLNFEINQQKKKQEKQQEKDKKKKFKIEIDKIINENPSDTDITKYYTNIMNDEIIKKLFGPKVTLENDYLIKDKTHSYKIFLKKNKDIDGYFYIKYFNSTNSIIIDKNYDMTFWVDEEGEWNVLDDDEYYEYDYEDDDEN